MYLCLSEVLEKRYAFSIAHCGVVTCEPDLRHAEITINKVHLSSSTPVRGNPTTHRLRLEAVAQDPALAKRSQRSSNLVSTPAVSESHLRWSGSNISKMRAERTSHDLIPSRLFFPYLPSDRPDLQFTAKMASRHMALPRVADSWVAPAACKVGTLGSRMRSQRSASKSTNWAQW